MKTHYFQRYHGEENVATANTMLLLERLYSYSPNKFFELLKSKFFQEQEEDDFEPESLFYLQKKEKDKKSIPDAIITQAGFKIVVETKMNAESYNPDQLKKHLDYFTNEKSDALILITIAPNNMDADLKQTFQNQVDDYNKDKKSCVKHINTTFEQLTHAVQDILEDRDYEMQDVLEDYLDYCTTNKLISDSWKYLRLKGAGTTIGFNRPNKIYYEKAHRRPRPHDYLGLYMDKKVCCIGKICAIITAGGTEQPLAEMGELTPERENVIKKAIRDSESYNYDLKSIRHRYFFVEEFIDTDFEKKSPRPLWGARFIDLTQKLGKEKLPNNTQEIADLLRKKDW